MVQKRGHPIKNYQLTLGASALGAEQCGNTVNSLKSFKAP